MQVEAKGRVTERSRMAFIGALGDSTARYALRHKTALLVALLAFFAFSPFIFLRYEFHDSWAWLYWLNSLRVFNFVTPCLEFGGHHYMIGRPLMTAVLCGMTAFGPEIDLVWIPKLFALLLLFATGALLLSTYRRAGADMVIAPFALLSLLFLPGMILMIVMMVANAIAYAVFAAVLAGYLWLRFLRDPVHRFRARLVLSVCVFLLLVVAMAIYQVVAVLFFLPLLIDILYRRREAGASQLGYPVLAALTFAGAAGCFILVHTILLQEFRYFFLSEQQVQRALGEDRSVALIQSAEDLAKKLEFMGVLLPRTLSLWFISESTRTFPIVTGVFAAVSAAFAALFVWRARNVWRVLAAIFTFGCFFGPFLLSANAGNGLYTLERVKVFMQVPLVVVTWWVVQFFFTTRWRSMQVVAAAIAGLVFVGSTVSWLVILRARVIPNYMELKHVEYRLKEAVRQNIPEIYIIKTEDRHLRAVIGDRGGSEEIGRITSIYFPEQMVSAILLEIEKKKIQRAIIPVDAAQGDSIKPAPNRLILDMRRFP